MTEHRPKTAALIAYASGLLSKEGRRRLEAHLETCEICQQELAAIEMYDSLVEDVRSAELPPIDFESMELPLAREAAALSREMVTQRRRRRVAPWVGLGIAAAVGLGIWAWPRAQEERSVAEHNTELPVEEETPIPTAPAPSPELSPVVTLAAGDAFRVGAEPTPLPLGHVLPEGSEVGTGQDGELHVRLRDGTGIRLGDATRAHLRRTREDDIRLELSAGSLAHEVSPLEAGSRFVVACAGYEVEVTGTRFVVSYLDDVVGVDLSEGSVIVRDPSGEETRLHAPARWRSQGGVDGDPAAPLVRATAAPRVAPTPVSLDDSRFVRWSIDGIDIDTAGPVRVGVAPGEHEVRGWDGRGRLFTTLLPVGDAPVMLEPNAMRPQAPRLRPGHLEPAEIQPVLRRGMRQVTACYERSLRNNSQVVRARLRIDIGVMGDVRRARVIGLPDGTLSTCICNYAMRWTFPPPGGPLSLEQPLTLTPRQ